MISLSELAIIKPKRIKPGAVIGVVAPASPFKPDTFEQGASILEAMGYTLRSAAGLFEAHGYLAGTDRQRAEQLHAMFSDDRVDAILCARGGFGALRILPLLDWDLIRTHPKPFVGFSDITALHQSIFLKSGLATFHGPMVCTLSRGDGQTRASLQQALCSDGPVRLIAHNRRTIRPGEALGLFVGGNLATLCHLLGTPFACNYRNCILFLEETGEAPYRIDRMLMQMKLAGCFDGLSGLVLGSFKNCGEQADVDELVRQLFDENPIPIMAGVDAGHSDRNLTLPLGISVCLDAERGELRFLEAATCA